MHIEKPRDWGFFCGIKVRRYYVLIEFFYEK
jgi:hypothetical protein